MRWRRWEAEAGDDLLGDGGIDDVDALEDSHGEASAGEEGGGCEAAVTCRRWPGRHTSSRERRSTRTPNSGDQIEAASENRGSF